MYERFRMFWFETNIKNAGEPPKLDKNATMAGWNRECREDLLVRCPRSRCVNKSVFVYFYVENIVILLMWSVAVLICGSRFLVRYVCRWWVPGMPRRPWSRPVLDCGGQECHQWHWAEEAEKSLFPRWRGVSYPILRASEPLARWYVPTSLLLEKKI